MVVVITNISDEAGEKRVSPTAVDVWNKTLAPGAMMKLPAELVDQRLRKLADQGLIAIGQVPPWYARAKQKGRGRALSAEERIKRITIAPPPKELPVEVPRIGFVELEDRVEVPEEKTEVKSKSNRRG